MPSYFPKLKRHVVVLLRSSAGIALDFRSAHRGTQEWLATNKQLVTIGAPIGPIGDSNKVVQVQLDRKRRMSAIHCKFDTNIRGLQAISYLSLKGRKRPHFKVVWHDFLCKVLGTMNGERVAMREEGSNICRSILLDNNNIES